ncbi:hypothetical protein CV739_13115 [Bacillus velezensis]|nr:hypothetical protein EEB07_02350 [Bacillus velezensis]PJN84088.1 hypothetical protein CV739_13115 [Bacillus velezensis]PRS99968.1 hypothetical protein C6354_08315 [Bacillus velezensis]
MNVFPMKNDFEPHRNPYITGFLLFFHVYQDLKQKNLLILKYIHQMFNVSLFFIHTNNKNKT